MLLHEMFDNLHEGVHDPHIFKALFVIGAPGSGKSAVAKKLTSWTGLRSVNPDDFYEMFLQRRMKATASVPADIESDPEWLRSRELKHKKLKLLLDGRLGLVIDGTGRYAPSIIRAIRELRFMGYDVAMLYVQTDTDTAVARQQLRNRRVDPEIVKQYHENIRENVPQFRELFTGDQADNFATVSNTGSSLTQVLTDPQYFQAESMSNNITADQWFRRWASEPVKSAQAQQWIQQHSAKPAVTEAVIKKTSLFAKNYKDPNLIKQNIRELNSTIDNANAHLKHSLRTKTQLEDKLKAGKVNKTSATVALKDVKYWITAYKKTIKSAQAEIAVQQADLEQAEQNQSKYQQQLPKIIAKVQAECSDYLAAFKKTKRVMWRGANRKNPWAFRAKTPAARQPRDSDFEETRIFNQILTKLGFEANRSNSIFVTSTIEQAENYGTLYVVVPKNTAKFTWSSTRDDVTLKQGEIDDYYQRPPAAMLHKERRKLDKMLEKSTTTYKQERIIVTYGDLLYNAEEHIPFTSQQAKFIKTHFPQSPLIDYLDSLQRIGNANFNLNKFQKKWGMKNTNLDAALKSGHEIMISGEYYAFHRSIWENIQATLLGK